VTEPKKTRRRETRLSVALQEALSSEGRAPGEEFEDEEPILDPETGEQILPQPERGEQGAERIEAVLSAFQAEIQSAQAATEERMDQRFAELREELLAEQRAALTRLDEALDELRAGTQEKSEETLQRFEEDILGKTERIQADFETTATERLEALASQLAGEMARENARLQSIAQKRWAEEFEVLRAHTLAAAQRQGATQTSAAPAPAEGSASPLIRVNDASASDLRALGLSRKEASRVLRYRDNLGGFTSMSQLRRVPGLSRALDGDLAEHLTL
jgi:DNA uptake protein ComE-like DNA-binding protein